MSAATSGPWVIGPRTGKYRFVPASERERAALEQINATQFEALSIGQAPNGPQVAIIPLDESSEANARLIVQAPTMRAALQQIARMQMDGEGGFVLENDDAVDSLHSCIRLAREALAGEGGQ